MSIDKLRVNLSGVFEYGQAYVALSRATSIEGCVALCNNVDVQFLDCVCCAYGCHAGLILEGFKPSLVRAHPE